MKKVKLILEYDPDLTATWNDLTALELAISNICHKDIILLLCNKLGQEEIKNSVQKVLRSEDEINRYLDIIMQSADSYNQGHGKIKRKCIKHETKKTNNTLPDMSDKTTLETYKVCYQSTNIMVSTNETDTISNCCSQLIWNESEVNHIYSSVRTVIQRVAELLSVDKHCMAFHLVQAGSVKEGTKCFDPDEIDYVCLFTFAVGLIFGRNRIRCNKSSPWNVYASPNGYLDEKNCFGFQCSSKDLCH